MRPRGLTAHQRANELVLRIGCIAEAFSGGTATESYAATTHELPRAVYEQILRDEARHRKIGPIYFEWALGSIDEKELQRLGRVLHSSLATLAPFWKSRSAKLGPKVPVPPADLQALGWLGPVRFAPIAKEVVVRDILDPLETIGIAITKAEREELLA
jgi:hypothetical protein